MEIQKECVKLRYKMRRLIQYKRPRLEKLRKAALKKRSKTQGSAQNASKTTAVSGTDKK